MFLRTSQRLAATMASDANAIAMNSFCRIGTERVNTSYCTDKSNLCSGWMSRCPPFCITIDRDSEAELKDLYGEVGYTIIDDVISLPERLPGIYRRLTT